jgi:hypothetical protein
MRLPRLRLTVRGIALAAVLGALIFGGVSTGVSLARRSMAYRRTAGYFARHESRARRIAAYHDDLAKVLMRRASTLPVHGRTSSINPVDEKLAAYWVKRAENYAVLRRKYETAAARPWLPVAPDPPNPE